MNKQQVIDLWRLSFNDTEEFIHLYFDRIYKEENTLVIKKDGQVVSALQILPYTMTYYGTEISVAYISGACTLPSMRGKGLMRELIQNAFEEMKSRSIAVTTLIPADPWLFDYYRKLGYTEAFDYSEKTYIRSEKPIWTSKLTMTSSETLSIDVLYRFFDKQMRKRSCCMLHTQEDFITIQHDLQLAGGQILAAMNEEEQLVGIAFIVPPNSIEDQSDTNPMLCVKELLCDNEEVENFLLHKATRQNNVSNAFYKIPPVVPNTRPMGMARVIDTERLLHHWLSTHKDSPVSEKILKEQDIQSFTQIVMGYPNREAYMSLMLD